MNVAEWLYRSALRAPEAPALFEGRRLRATYREFAARAGCLAAKLRDRHALAPGDRVAIYMANRVEYLDAMYGAWFAGAVIVPVNYKLHPKEAADILRDCGATVLVTDAGSADALRREAPASVALIDLDARAEPAGEGLPAARPLQRRDEDPAWLFYTSGTTGKPKGAILSHGNLVAMSLTYLACVDDVTAQDAALYAAPMSHGAGLYNMVHVLRGSRHVVPASRGFDPAEILSLGPEVGPLSMFAAPNMVRRLVQTARSIGRDGEGLRTIVYGGGPMYVADIKDALDVLGPRFVQIYGQGESPMCITVLSRTEVADSSHRLWERRLSSVGSAQSCVDVQVVDEDGRPVPHGEVGEIVVRGPTVMAGYWNAPEATDRALRNGWLWTGDLGLLDDEGLVTLADRSKDVVISGGSNIYPREVEECLLLDPRVQAVSAVGVPNPEWGEILVAFVVCYSGEAATPAELDALCHANIARFKKPKQYVFVDRLPTNAYGKVPKAELRALYLARQN